MHIFNKRIKAIISTTIAVILMSQSVVLTKIAYNSVTPATFLWMTTLVGIIVMSFYTFIYKKEVIPKHLFNRRVWIFIFLIGFFNFVTGQFTTLSLIYLSPTTNTYLSKFVGFLTMFFSILILKEKPGIFQFFGAGISLIGLRIFFPTTLQPDQIKGVLLVLIGITGLAITNNLTRKLAIETKNEISNNLVSTLAIIFGGSIMSITCMIIDGLPPKISKPIDLLLIIHIGVSVKAIALALWNKNLREMRSYEVSLLGASMVIWTSLLSLIILGEKISSNQIIGIIFLVTGLIFVQIRKQLKARDLFKIPISNWLNIKGFGFSEKNKKL